MDKCSSCGGDQGLRLCGCGQPACEVCVTGICRNCAKPTCSSCERDGICGACREKEAAIIRRYETSREASWTQAEEFLRKELAQNPYLLGITKRLQGHNEEKEALLQQLRKVEELVEKKAYFSAMQELEQIPRSFDYPERMELQEKVKEVLATVEEYLLDAHNREFSNKEQALNKYRKAGELISDHPVILERLPALEQEIARHAELVNEVRAKMAEKHFFRAQKMLESIPLSYQFPERDALAREIETELNMARIRLENLKTEKDIDEIAKGCRELLGKVADFSEAEEFLKEIEQKRKGLKKKLKELKKSINREDLARASKLIEELRPGPYDSTFLKLVRIFEEKVKAKEKKRGRMHVIAACSVLLLLTAVVAWLYFQSAQRVKEAAAIYAELDAKLGTLSPNQAEALLKKGLALIDGAVLAIGTEKEQLARKFEAIRQSEEYRSLMAGFVRFKGRYVQKDLLPKLKECDALLAEADKAFGAEEWGTADRLYTSLIDRCSGKGLAEALPLDPVRTKAHKARQATLQQMLEEAKGLMESEELDKAEKLLRSASLYAAEKELGETAVAKEVRKQLEEVISQEERQAMEAARKELSSLIDGAERLLEQGKLKEAIAGFENARKFFDSKGVIDPVLRRRIVEGLLMGKALLYQRKAAELSDKGELDKAGILFEAMAEVAREGLKVPGLEPDTSARMKGLLVEAVTGLCRIRRKEADGAAAGKEFDKAITLLSSCKEAAKANGVSGEPALKAVLDEVTAKQEEAAAFKRREALKKELFVMAPKLFPNYFQSVLPAEFTGFNVSHVGGNRKIETFHLSADAKKRSITVHCILEASYDLGKRKWTFRVAGNEISF